MTSLCVLLAVAAKFDLETLQLDVVNVFVLANLDKTLFMYILPEFSKNGKVLQLNRALYSLCRSFLLWQQKLTNKLKWLDFKKIPQEPYVLQKDGIIGFFYVDDIVFIYKKNKEDEITRIKKSLKQRLTIKEVSKLKWFLGLYMVQNCSKQTIWLSQKAYILKICSELLSY